jgi:2-polyprenyl-3-methyl-5-hydroxy-6-metoxy-1,4-benzoquinol methylase
MDHDPSNRDTYGELYGAEHQKPFSFEAVLSASRRAQALQFVRKYPHRSILEVGCGPIPLFIDLTGYDQYIIIEPIKAFATNASHIAVRYPQVRVIEAFIEEESVTRSIHDVAFNCIILSGVLHEVPDPGVILHSIRQLCGAETRVFISTPNMFSVHRLLAREMGLISDITDPSSLDIRYGHPHHFDRQSLYTLIEQYGFEVLAFATYFVKPFTNEQMEAMIDQNIVDRAVVEGLERLVRYMPDLGAEMYAVVRKRPEPVDPI